MSSNATVVICPPHSYLSVLDNKTCICDSGFAPPGLCFFDAGYAQSDAYAVFIAFFVVAFTSLAVLSLYEVLYAVYRKDFRAQMFYPSRIVTFFMGVGTLRSSSSLLPNIIVGVILYAGLEYWRGIPFQSLPRSTSGYAVLFSLSIFLFLAVASCLAANWIIFFYRIQILQSRVRVVLAVAAVCFLALLDFSLYVAGIGYLQPPTNPVDPVLGTNLSFAASGMLVGITALWAISFLLVGTILFRRIQTSALEVQRRRRSMLKLLVGTSLAVCVALAYSVLVLCVTFIYPVTPSNPAIFETSTKYSSAVTSLQIALAVAMMWLIRPLHETENVAESASSKDFDTGRSGRSEQSQTVQVSIMNIDD